MIARKVAQAASAGYVTNSDFEAFWPPIKKEETPTPSWSATPLELRMKILNDLKKR